MLRTLTKHHMKYYIMWEARLLLCLFSL